MKRASANYTPPEEELLFLLLLLLLLLLRITILRNSIPVNGKGRGKISTRRSSAPETCWLAQGTQQWRLLLLFCNSAITSFQSATTTTTMRHQHHRPSRYMELPLPHRFIIKWRELNGQRTIRRRRCAAADDEVGGLDAGADVKSGENINQNPVPGWG